jgi:hypothetical protein
MFIGSWRMRRGFGNRSLIISDTCPSEKNLVGKAVNTAILCMGFYHLFFCPPAGFS